MFEHELNFLSVVCQTIASFPHRRNHLRHSYKYCDRSLQRLGAQVWAISPASRRWWRITGDQRLAGSTCTPGADREATRSAAPGRAWRACPRGRRRPCSRASAAAAADPADFSRPALCPCRRRSDAAPPRQVPRWQKN